MMLEEVMIHIGAQCKLCFKGEGVMIQRLRADVWRNDSSPAVSGGPQSSFQASPKSGDGDGNGGVVVVVAWVVVGGGGGGGGDHSWVVRGGGSSEGKDVVGGGGGWWWWW